MSTLTEVDKRHLEKILGMEGGYEQMVSRFSPDEYTAKLCFQVLKAALASVAGERE